MVHALAVIACLFHAQEDLAMTPLRQRMIEDMRVRNYSPKTIRNYVAQVRLFAESFGQSPANLGVEQIRTYQVYLVQERGISWSSFNITVT